MESLLKAFGKFRDDSWFFASTASGGCVGNCASRQLENYEMSRRLYSKDSSSNKTGHLYTVYTYHMKGETVVKASQSIHARDILLLTLAMCFIS